MKRFLKILSVFCFLSSLIILAGLATFENTFRIQENLPSFTTIKERKNIAVGLPMQQRHVIRKSRESAVRIISYSAAMDGIASLSGTYFQAFGKYYVLTVVHGLGNRCNFTKIIVDDKFFNCLDYTIINAVDDYAIIEVEPIPIRSPIRIPQDLPKNQEWTHDIPMLMRVFHTGYPNNMGPLTFDGKIIGYSDDNHIYINSYAWSGSSGSGVFNEKGKLIGYVLALDVGVSEYGVDILEDIVVVVPTSAIDWNYFFETALKINELKKLYSLERK
jgi:RNase H-fold protein (predicted Holliday junction resolvase)